MDKLLIIDDSLVQGQALSNMVSDEYIVECCQCGFEGIKKAKEIKPNLILLDIVMPKIDGFEVLKQLKACEETMDIPTILITGLADKGNEEKGLSLGAVDYITKPFTKSIVMARVKTHTQLYAYRSMFKRLAMLDELTGLPNRRSYDERCAKEWSWAIESKSPISIALMDIDFFKQFNDNYGHSHGDVAIKEVARIIMANEREKFDFAARYGGEEFILIMPNTSAEEAKTITERIRRQIEGLQIAHERSAVSKYLTISIGGVTLIPNTADHYERYFNLTDEMLYRAKANGRNNITWME